MHLKHLLTFLSFFLFYNGLFAQRKLTPITNYNRILKLNFAVNHNRIYRETSEYTNDLLVRKSSYNENSFTTTLTPSISFITERKNILEFELKTSFNATKILESDGETPYISSSSFTKTIPDDLNIVSRQKNKNLFFSIRTSYNFNLIKQSPKIYFTIGPSGVWYYDFRKVAPIYKNGLEDKSVMGIDLEAVSKFGISLGKRVVLETAIPFKIFNINDGDFYYSRKEERTVRAKTLIFNNYITERFVNKNYTRPFSVQLSFGYKF